MSTASNPYSKLLDSVTFGVLLGLVTPILVLFGFYLMEYSGISVNRFYTEILIGHNILNQVVSLCVVANLLVFFIFIWTNQYYSARGVLLATIIYAGFVMYRKFI